MRPKNPPDYPDDAIAEPLTDAVGLEDHLDRSGRSDEPVREIKRLGGWVSFMSSVEGPEATERFHKKHKAGGKSRLPHFPIGNSPPPSKGRRVEWRIDVEEAEP